jgi:hypothetical protein
MRFFTTQGENREWCSCAHVFVTRADKKNGSHDNVALMERLADMPEFQESERLLENEGELAREEGEPNEACH